MGIRAPYRRSCQGFGACTWNLHVSFFRLCRRIYFEPDAVRLAGDLTQNFRIHPASGAKPAEDLAERAGVHRWNFCLVHHTRVALDRTQSCRTRCDLGWVAIHECLFWSWAECGCACLRAQVVRRVRNFAAAKHDPRSARQLGSYRQPWLVFPGRLGDCPRNALHGAVSRHRTRVCVYAIARCDLVDVPRNRCRNELAVFAPVRATGLAALLAKAGAVDAARKAIHGISVARDVALSALRARRPTGSRWRNLGELFFADDRDRVLDERRVCSADRIGREAKCRARAHARNRAREWHLFYRRQISFREHCLGLLTTPRRPAGVHTRAFKNGTRTGAFWGCHFYVRLVS